MCATSAFFVLRDFTTCECLTVVRVVTFVIGHLHSVLVVYHHPHHPNHVWSGAAPVHIGSTHCFHHILYCPPSSYPYCMESLRDSLVPIQDRSIRLDRDAAATPLDDTIQDSSNLLEVRISTYHKFLDLVLTDIILMRSSTADRFSTNRDAFAMHACHDVFNLDATLPHAWARDPSRQLEVAECQCKLFLPPTFVRRLPYKLYCNSPHMCSSPAR